MPKVEHRGLFSVKKILVGEEGISLIEALVALVIFSLVVAVFTAYFINTFLLINLAGRKSEILFSVQAQTEEEMDTVVGDEDELRINFPGRAVTVEGTFILVEEEDHDGQRVRLEAFSPGVIRQEED